MYIHTSVYFPTSAHIYVDMFSEIFTHISPDISHISTSNDMFWPFNCWT